jgi:CubicO group peptidase (beta-lactamase class C family)
MEYEGMCAGAHNVDARRQRTAITRAFVAIPILAFAAAAQTPSRAAIDAFRTQLRTDVAADAVGGVTAAVVVGDRVVWAEGFGWVDREKHIPASVETIYRIGSISKTFTAVVLAQLVDRRVIRLDDPVERYLPEVRGFKNARPGAKPITFRQLASHTAGLIREPQLANASSGPIAQWESKVLASIPTTSFDAMPGAQYSYSNIGYGVLGLALARAAQKPFIQLVHDDIFTPLGMTNSTFIIDDRLRPWLSVGYVNGPDGINATLPAQEHLGRGYKVPNGGIYTTVSDLARFIGALTGAGKTVVSDSMRRAMMTKQTPEQGPSGYGLGLMLLPNRVPTVFSHGGAVAGYTAMMAFEPDSEIGVIILRNYLMGETRLDAAANELVRALVADKRPAR